MRTTRLLALVTLGTLALAACGDDDGAADSGPSPDGHLADAGSDAASCVPAPGTPTTPTCGKAAGSNIEHVVIIVQENHSFDSYFGHYCTAATGSNPTCTTGPACCEAAPAMEASGASPLVLDDTQNGNFDPNHEYDCNLTEINGGLMDGFVVGDSNCADPQNFAVADPTGPVAPYVAYAQAGAIADRYFQPVVGQSSSNDMYPARAAFVFKDNTVGTNSIGSTCGFSSSNHQEFSETTIGDLLEGCAVTWKWYGGGYEAMKTAVAGGGCATKDPACPVNFGAYPCIYDPTDVPFQYYTSLKDDPAHFVDIQAFATDVANGTLPAVSYIKPLGFRTEHPGFNIKISDGTAAVAEIVDPILASNTYKDNTLILITYDEGGGYYDHVPPPPTSAIDCQPYGVRAVFMVLGAFAKQNYVSHVQLEHSSIVKFLEWNFFSGATGHLGTRDTTVNNIGDLLDPAKTGATVPSN